MGAVPHGGGVSRPPYRGVVDLMCRIQSCDRVLGGYPTRLGERTNGLKIFYGACTSSSPLFTMNPGMAQPFSQ